MSTFNDIDITCEKCAHEFRGTIWTAIHAKQDPELKDILLGGELNMVMCPECAYVAYHDHFVLYQDPSAELVAYVYPESEQPRADELKVMVKKGFEDAQSVFTKGKRITYEPALIFGLENLVEMMHEEESRGEQSQVAEALCREQHIPFAKLPPSQARAKQLPRVIPLATGDAGTSREEIIGGLTRLLAADPALDVYSRLKDRMKLEPNWKL
jgi:hypothetical protein